MILVKEYFNFKISRFNLFFYKNLIIVACLFGCMNIFWQIHNCIGYGNYLNYLKYIMKTSNEVIVKIPIETYNKNNEISNLLNATPCYGTILISLLLSESYNVNKVIFPPKERIDYFCYADKDQTYYNENRKYLSIQTSRIPIKNKYWDLTAIAKELKKQNIINSY